MEYDQMSDQELTMRLVENDHLAISVIYKRYWLLLCHHAHRMTHDGQLARDLVQDIFCNILKDVTQVKQTLPIDIYLFSCVRNRVINAIRNQQCRAAHLVKLQSYTIQPGPGADEVMIAKDLQQLIEKEIRLMPPKMRRAFELSRKNQLTPKEISRHTGSSIGTIKKQLHLASAQLRSKLALFRIMGILICTLLLR